MVSGVKEYCAHTRNYGFLNARGNLIRHLLVCNMPPPKKNIGIAEQLVGNILNIIERYGFNRNIIVCQVLFKGVMYSLGIYCFDIIIGFFM